jgi:hypothetical protein
MTTRKTLVVASLLVTMRRRPRTRTRLPFWCLVPKGECIWWMEVPHIYLLSIYAYVGWWLVISHFIVVIYYVICNTGYFFITLVHNVLMERFRGISWRIVCKGIWGLSSWQCTHLGGSYSLNCWIHTSLLYNQIVLSSITKKGEIESASRLLIILVIMTMKFGWINAFNKMCAGLKE